MADQKLIENWLDKANEDLAFAKANLEEGLDFYTQICFHFHQAAEKFLKAYIIAKGLNFKKIHDLTKLRQTCAEKDREFNKLSEEAKILNPFYIGARYPDFLITTDKPRAEKAFKAVEKIKSFVESKLSV